MLALSNWGIGSDHRPLVATFEAEDMARKLKVCPSTISNSKKSLAGKIQDCMGCKILVDIQRQPKWRNDLAANKERLACKHERCH